MINKKQRLYNKAKKFKRETVWTLFRKFHTVIQKKIQLGYWKYLVHTINPKRDKEKKSFWYYIKSPNKDTQQSLKLQDKGILRTNSKSTANILSYQFQSVYTKENLINFSQVPNQNRSHKCPQSKLHILINY